MNDTKTKVRGGEEGRLTEVSEMYKQTSWIILMDRWLDGQTEEWNHWWMNGRVDWFSAHAKFNKFMDLALSWSGLLLKAGCLSNVHHFQQSSKFALQKKKTQKQ